MPASSPTASGPARAEELESPLSFTAAVLPPLRKSLAEELAGFREFGQPTRKLETSFTGPQNEIGQVPTFVNEFWTAKQRQANSLHEISYRACFKPQLPRFFIERLTQPRDVVYDPFMGRGTTLIEAALLGRVPFGCDVNPLSAVLTKPRLRPPFLEQVAERLREIDLARSDKFPEELLVFFHPDTLRQIAALKKYLLERLAARSLDAVDEWICLVALNRLTGHSSGFFSVYTLPPNQAVSVKSQQKINDQRKQSPAPRDIRALILKKTRILLRDCDSLARRALSSVAAQSLVLTQASARTPEILSNSVSLVVTSPPFLD